MSGMITNILTAGIDSFAHLYDVRFLLPTKVSAMLATKSITLDTTFVSVRTGDFKPPELNLDTYTTDYKGFSLTRPAPKVAGARTFDISFRLDNNHSLLKALGFWKHLWFDPSGEGDLRLGGLSTQGALTDGERYGKIAVVSYKAETTLASIPVESSIDGSDTDVAESWLFYDVICTKIGTPSFSRGNATPLTVTASFIFGRMKEPGATFSTPTGMDTPGLLGQF